MEPTRPHDGPSGGIPPGAMLAFGIAMLGLAVALVASLGGMQSLRSREAKLAARAESLTVEIERLRGRLAREAGRGPGGAASAVLIPEGLDEAMIHRMRRLGWQDPAGDLRRDLMKHPELIPMEGVLGGTMGFHSEDLIRILGNRWVLAGFDDGHVSGRLLLEFEITGSTIRWKPLAWHRD